jgi:hypothetical protein
MNTRSQCIDPVRNGTLESELQRATDRARQGNARYWLAYRRGLRRGFGGPEAVSDGEHQRWLRLHPALHREELAGYSDALLSVTTAGPRKVTTVAPSAPHAVQLPPTATTSGQVVRFAN